MTQLRMDDISKYLVHLYNEQTKTILDDISKTYNIPKETLYNKYINNDILKDSHSLKKKRKKIGFEESGCLCMARKQDGNQCTRRRKDSNDYCGKHINNRKYGRIDDHSNIVDKLAEDDNYIMTWIEKFNGEEFLVDSNNIIYTKDVSSPIIVGRKLSQGVMESVGELPIEV